MISVSHLGRLLSVKGASAVRYASSRASRRIGLVGPTSTEKFYAQKLDLVEAATIISEPGFLWSAAEADAKKKGVSTDGYLKTLNDNVSSFFERKELHDRTSEIDLLEHRLAQKKGTFGLVLGGKTLAKTFMIGKLQEKLVNAASEFPKQQEARLKEIGRLRHAASDQLAAVAELDPNDPLRLQAEVNANNLLEQAATLDAAMKEIAITQKPRRLIIYDARKETTDLPAGLIASIERQAPKSFYDRFAGSLSRYLPAMAAGGAVITGADSSTAVKGATLALHTALGGEKGLKAVLEAYITACEADGHFPCIVIDELNRALKGKTDADKEKTLDTLQMLVGYAKQDQRLNVLLASSEHSEPFRLRDIGFKSSHFSYSMLVSDVAPVEMRSLLRDKWGMEAHLMDAVMAVWGGEHAA